MMIIVISPFMVFPLNDFISGNDYYWLSNQSPADVYGGAPGGERETVER